MTTLHPTDTLNGSGLLTKAQAILKSPWVIGIMVVGLIWALVQVAPPSHSSYRMKCSKCCVWSS